MIKDKHTKRMTFKNFNDSLENIGYSLGFRGCEHYEIVDYKGRWTGWMLFGSELKFETGTITNPVSTIVFLFRDCVLKTDDDHVVTVTQKGAENPGIFVSFYNFNKRKRANPLVDKDIQIKENDVSK